jgi:hypothetical protein
MRTRRLPAALAILALLLQALAPLAPARAEPAVICGADGPTVVLLDLATGQPVAPAEEHGFCAVCLHCASCPGALAPVGASVPTREPAAASASTARALADEGAARCPVRVRGPPSAATV